MYYRSLALSLLASNLCFSQALPQNYESLSATAKQELLWHNVQASEYAEGQLPDLESGPGLRLSNLRKRYLKRSFTHTADEMPEGRLKIIHTFGTVVPVRWVPGDLALERQYTGIFREGGEGLLRLSLAQAPSKGIVPGMALKILLSENPSVNIFAMEKLEGQGDDKNFFAKTFSHKIPRPESRTLRFVSWLFSFAHKTPEKLSIRPFAVHNSAGEKYLSVRAPLQVFFVPGADTKTLDFTDRDFREVISEIPVGSEIYTIYDVYGNSLGYLETTGVATASQYGDEKLFFQHPDDEV